MRGRNYDAETANSSGCSTFMTGALIGAGVALLLAPQSGSELRGRLRNYADRAKEDVMNQGEEALDIVVERGKEYYDKGEEVVQDAGRSAKEFAKQGAEQGQEAVKDGGRAAKEFAKHAQDVVREAGR